jgi:uncharacterized protein (TIGR03435 family)
MPRALSPLSCSLLFLFAVDVVVKSHGQDSEPRLFFEVVSVKRQAGPLRGGAGPSPPPRRAPDTFYRANATLSSLIRFAYGVGGVQVVGGPDWIHRDLFEINARAQRPALPDEMRLMVRSLLHDRFGLVIRREHQDMRHGVLIVARQDGRLGPGLRTCEEASNAPPRPVPVPVGAAVLSRGSADCVAMSAVALTVSALLETPVIDKTGLIGSWSYHLLFAERQPLPLDLAREVSDASVPSLPAALEEQLGLKLDYTNGPVEVMVIESVQQLSED